MSCSIKRTRQTWDTTVKVQTTVTADTPGEAIGLLMAVEMNDANASAYDELAAIVDKALDE